jgi:hypothetical protein
MQNKKNIIAMSQRLFLTKILHLAYKFLEIFLWLEKANKIRILNNFPLSF